MHTALKKPFSSCAWGRVHPHLCLLSDMLMQSYTLGAVESQNPAWQP